MASQQQTYELTLMVVGDGSVGKTCVLSSYANNSFDPSYVPIVFENTSVDVNIENHLVKVTLIDTAGQEGYDNIRKMLYPKADIFVIVFSVVEKNSFQNAVTTWNKDISTPDLTHKAKILLGNKSDLRQTSNPNHIQTQVGCQIASQNHLDYFECSALTKQGIDEAMVYAIQQGFVAKYQQQKQTKDQECHCTTF